MTVVGLWTNASTDGAGIKGKVVDAWRYGLPAVTTPVGAEGMHGAARRIPGAEPTSAEGGAALGEAAVNDAAVGEGGWGGGIASDADGFVAQAVHLYTDRPAWEAAQARGRQLLRELYSPTSNLLAVYEAVESARAQLSARRARDYAGAALWQHSARATEYFARWIELKETRLKEGSDPPCHTAAGAERAQGRPGRR